MANSRELAEQALSLLQDVLQESGIREAELTDKLKAKRTPKSKLEKQAQVLVHRLETMESERDDFRRESNRLEEILENERVKIQQLKKKLAVAESGPDKVGKKELNYWRSRAEQFEQEKQEFRSRISELKQTLQDQADAGQPGESASPDAGNLQRLVEELQTENGQLVADLAARATELVERDARIAELTEAQRSIDDQQKSVRDQIASLENELREEKECTVNLSEIANERREQITELSEQLDEANERYEEAKWRLEQASRFERLVARRRKLIDSLIAGLRAKQKSNTALKAGIDGLRRFKSKSEEQQQKLLVRVQELTDELKEAEDRLVDQAGAREASQKLRQAEEKVALLQERLDAQVEVIDSLETELNAVKAAKQATENQSKELAELRETLESRNETIANLEADFDELQKKLANAGAQETEGTSESVTGELGSQIETLQERIESQEKEIARLNEDVDGWRRKYEFLSTDAPSAYANDLTSS
jgi:chromosome segregation ATPase